jgi:hypothetical protein
MDGRNMAVHGITGRALLDVGVRSAGVHGITWACTACRRSRRKHAKNVIFLSVKKSYLNKSNMSGTLHLRLKNFWEQCLPFLTNASIKIERQIFFTLFVTFEVKRSQNG